MQEMQDSVFRERMTLMKLHEERYSKLTVVFKKRVEALCKRNFENNQQLNDCASFIDQRYPSVENCIFDLLYLDDEKVHMEIIKAIEKKFSIQCEKEMIVRPHPVEKHCSVGEYEETEKGGICNAKYNGDEKCAGYCSKKYAEELLDSQCRGNVGKKECVCSLSKSDFALSVN